MNNPGIAKDNKPLFSFGVITDTHIRAPDGDQSSPFPVNDLANDRAIYAAKLLAEQQTLFNIHLGDMVHPLPGMPAYNSACEAALDAFKPLQPNLYFVAGNHDVGDKPMPGLPAAAINADALKCYTSHFGKSYYCFEQQNCLFIVLNSSLINSQSPEAKTQQSWLEDILNQCNNDRVFLFLHYPIFIHSETEEEHYDNIAEPGRSWLINLIRQHSVELVLSGHVHHYFFNRIDQCCLYTLPPTSFTRQDYAELFKVEPAPEYGRDDTGKYSVAVVEVFASGHQVKIIPTHGNPASKVDNISNLPEKISNINRKQFTVHLRHPWHESIDLPYNGPMEEFSRKRARNDYLFMRLQQMGIADVRVPLQEIKDPTIRRRVLDYKAQGFRFHIFSTHGQLAQSHLTSDELESVSSLEYVSTGDIQQIQEPVFEHNTNIPVNLGYALSGAHQSDSGAPFAHSVTSGFEWNHNAAVVKLVGNWQTKISAIVFQIRWEENLQEKLFEMQNVFSALPYKCIANVRLSSTNPATANFDEAAIFTRIQTMLTQAENLSSVDLQVDTTMDVDRGYSPRYGLLDRLGNLRRIGHWLSNH